MKLLLIEHSPLGLILSSIIAYASLLVLVRWTGYRTIGNMSALGFIVSITVGTAVTTAILAPEATVMRGLLVAGTFVVLEVLLARISVYSPIIRQMIYGTPVALVEKGKLLESNLNRQGINADQLTQLMRGQQAFHLSDVETAILEPSGKLTVQFKPDKAPIQPGQLGLTVPPAAGLPRLIINDGVVRQEQLYALGFNETWLMQQLAKRGYTNLQDIVLAQADASGKLYVDTTNDFHQPQQPQDNMQILAGLQKLQADLASYSLETDDPAIQRQFHGDAKRVSDVLTSLAPHLQA